MYLCMSNLRLLAAEQRFICVTATVKLQMGQRAIIGGLLINSA